MITKFQWLIKQLKTVSGTKGKIFLLLFYIFRTLTYPIWMIKKFDYFKLFFLSDVLIRTKDGIYFCRKRSWDSFYVREDYEIKLRKYFQINRGIFIDVGAHIGRYTIMVARKLRNKGMVISFEPERGNFQALLNNIAINKLNNVIPLNLALYSKASKLKLYLVPAIGIDGHSIYKKTSKYQEVKTITIDQIVKKLKVNPKLIKLIKLDVQGAEPDILEGARRTLKQTNARIIFESHNREHLQKCEKILNELGYKSVVRIDDRNFLAEK
ncbi:MAG: FkbM family methyltransferase [Candidatus Aenigmatarchaeota archaeon]